MTHSSSNRREKFGGMTPEIDRLLVKGYKAKLKETTPSQKKSIEQECKCDTNIFCPIHQPPQKKDKRTYEETLETVRKLSKLMQKEGWEDEFDEKFVITGPHDESEGWETMALPPEVKSFIKSLLKVERERIKKEMLEVIEIV